MIADLLSTDRVWYHGTSTEAGLDEGDYLDPARGGFEPCVWVTSCPKAAMQYARSRAVLGGDPVVYRVAIVGGATVVEGDETTEGADIAVIVDGEHRVPMAAILERHSAYVDGIHAD